MPTPATVTYFIKSTLINTTRFETGTLADNDLIRRDDAGEGIVRPGGTNPMFSGLRIFEQTGPNLTDGRFVQIDSDILARVTFSDGTTLTNVRGLFDSISFPYGAADQFFLLDPAALAAVGKSITDVVDVTRTSFTVHDLDWSDFGISGTPIDPILPPPPPPPPVLNRIEGTAGRDVLRGTAADDLIIGHGGTRDTLTGRSGADTFVFGSEAGNDLRDVAVITDYNAYLDTILLTDNARIARTIEGATDITIILAGGDGDRIILKDQPDSGPLYRIQFDPDFFG